jgi:ribosomal protein L29
MNTPEDLSKLSDAEINAKVATVKNALIHVMMPESNVGVMWESSNVGEMRGSSKITNDLRVKQEARP